MKPIDPDGTTTLPTYDPWDGDPAQFDTVVANLVKREGDVTEVRLGIASLLADPNLSLWLGRSADAFRNTLGPLPAMLDQMTSAYTDAADAVRAYAQALRDGKAAFAKVQSNLQAQASTTPDGLSTLLASQASDASAEHDTAKRTCANKLAVADQDLRGVAAKLAATSFNDFDAAIVANGGSLADLAGLASMGMDRYNAQVDAVRSALAGDKGAIPPDVLSTEVENMLNAYGGNPDFWVAFGPLVGKFPAYLLSHDRLPDGSLPPADQALLTQLGQAAAKAADAGSMASVVAASSVSDLLGLSTVVAAAGGGQAFGKGPGAMFLSDLVTKLVNTNTYSDPISYNTALTQALQAAAENGDAVRLALSSAEGQQLATELLQGSVSLKEQVGTVGGSYTNTVGPKFTDPAAISAFLNAGLMGKRGSDPVAMQEIQAALNVVRAAAAFHGWDPSDPSMPAEVGPLPESITQALIHFASNNSLDLALSTQGSSDGLSTVQYGPNAPFYNFTVTQDELKSFLSLALADPKNAAAYRGWLQGSYTGLVQAAIQDGPKSDWTQPYSQLIIATQAVIDKQQLDAAGHADAMAANHVMVFNMLTGALGNAPGGEALGIAQTVDGFLQPLAGSPPTTDGGLLHQLFDQSHTATVALGTHQDDINQIQHMQVLVAQGALDSGRLTPDMLSPGVVVDGKVQDNTAFQTWYGTLGSKLVLGPPAPPHPDALDKALTPRSLQEYVNEFTNALELH
ncbi:hypothetical protein KGQ19_00635 [Catenulispora sp. NL8]|uniref:Uncharacterized protein n=1 Tax=Catenulispora pinistramenti TaxID=2705254 RepID=A0ABS5KHK5_9ACTN|nr:hypothetical protein [Catenulispora pinistramenti]MBS2545365.1 hypothetical protein [Catenulispora pinistramenti]